MDIDDLKIKNLDINMSAFMKKKVYKLCIGVIVIGAVIGAFIGSNNFQSNKGQSFADVSIEEVETSRAIVDCYFSNINYLDQDGDRIVFVRDDEFIAAIVRINSDGSGNFEAALVPGNYKVVSKKIDMIEFEVDSVDQTFVLDVDYSRGVMNIGQVDELIKSK